MDDVKTVDIWDELMRKPNWFQKIWWPIYRFFANLHEKPFLIKCWFQRANKGYDESYYWGIDYRLVKIVLPVLKDLRKHTHGHPGQLNSMEEWYEILDKMIAGWEAANRVCDDDYLSIIQPNWYEKGERIKASASRQSYLEMKRDIKIFEKSMPLFTKYFFNLWD